MDILTKKLYGAAYYPELWDEGEIEKDIARFRELRIDTVRMGEFAWSNFEPSEGKFDFSLFDRALEKLHAAGIAVVFCTPTATPPRWFTARFPESAWVDKEGRAMSHGSREHVCVANDDYLGYSVRIAEKLAEHYKDHPAIVAWQIHNEINWPQRECFCENCAKKWARWLKNKYGDIGALNRAWANGIWSMEYSSFEEVVQPFPTPYLHNTALLTEYTRFTYENAADFIAAQARAIKKFSAAPVTTNLSRVFYLDLEQIAACVDFVSLDDYSEQSNFCEQALSFDLFRNLKAGTPFVFMETSPSHGGCVLGTGEYHRRGYLIAELAASLFAGGAGMSYWLWRQQRAGCEQLHGHILQAFGAPSLAYPAVKEAGAAYAELSSALQGAKSVPADVALLYSDDARTYFMHETFGQVDYYRDILNSYTALLKTSARVDVLPCGAPLTGYRLIYVPLLPYLSEKLQQKLHEAAKAGATVVFGAYTGWRNGYHALYTDRAFGKCENLFGISVRHLAQLKSENFFVSWNGKDYPLTGHTALFENGEGKIEGGPADGGFALCERACGKGRAVFVGGMFGGGFEQDLLDLAVRRENIARADKEFGILHYEMRQGERRLLCVVNMAAEEKKMFLKEEMTDVTSGRTMRGEIALQSCEFKIFR